MSVKSPALSVRAVAFTFAFTTAVLVLNACGTAPRTEPASPSQQSGTPPVAPVIQGRLPSDGQTIISANNVVLLPVSYKELPGWALDDFSQVWQAWLRSCAAKRNAALEKACGLSQNPALAADVAAQRAFFESQFMPHRMSFADGKDTGLLTGYYEPLLKGSRTRSAQFNVPLYAKPDDLLPLAVVNSSGEFTRSRRAAQGVVPYWSRAEIETGAGAASVANKAWVYVDDPIEALFLQIQGSGRIVLQEGPERGQQVRAAFADHNGHTFKSIGQWLIQRGEMKLEDASMQSIKAWIQRNPARLNELLAANPRYIFFREEKIVNTNEGPKGSIGVPLTTGRSVAVDPKAVALGVPLWMDSTEPLNTKALQRLVFAQDVGAAITGNIRADFFWGTGVAAGEQAGRTKQALRLYVLLPKS